MIAARNQLFFLTVLQARHMITKRDLGEIDKLYYQPVGAEATATLHVILATHQSGEKGMIIKLCYLLFLS